MWTSFCFSNSLENPESKFKKKSQQTTLCIDDRAAVQLNWLCPTLGKKKQKREKEKKKDWQGQKRSTDAFIKYKRPTESWLPERSLTIHIGVNIFLKNKHPSFQKEWRHSSRLLASILLDSNRNSQHSFSVYIQNFSGCRLKVSDVNRN